MFQHVDPYAGDPILSLMEEFGKDERTEKVNLSIGLYYNEESIVPQLEAVKKAYKNIIFIGLYIYFLVSVFVFLFVLLIVPGFCIACVCRVHHASCS